MLIIKILLQVICTIVPLIIIYRAFSISLKNTVEGGKDIKKDLPILFRNLVAGLIIFLIPVMINFTFNNLLSSDNDFVSCINNASIEGVLAAEAREEQEAADKKKQEEEENLRISKEMQEKRKKEIEEAAEKRKEQGTYSTTFNLEHAINVHDNIHWSGNSNLAWQGKLVGNSGGDIGAYTEAVNILNETDYRIYEVYNVIVSKYPDITTKSRSIAKLYAVNEYYHIKSSIVKDNIDMVDEALQNGKLVHGATTCNCWTNDKGEHVEWKGTHNGLIFYFDGTYYHMKAAGSINQKDSIYTRAQLETWLADSARSLILYEKS